MRSFLRLSSLIWLTIPLLFSSCASILNGSQQDVQIRTGKSDAKVYIDGEPVGKGRTVRTTLDRDNNPKYVRVEAEGYKPYHTALVQTDRPFVYYLSWFPFGPPSFFIIPAADDWPSAHNYKDRYAFRDYTPFPERTSDEKFLYLDGLTFNVEKEKLNLSYFVEYEEFKKGNDPARRIDPEEGVTFTDEDGKNVINSILNRYNYIDTSKSVFRDKANTVNMEAEIQELGVDYCLPNNNPNNDAKDDVYTVKATSKIHFKLKSIYDDQLYEETLRVTSGIFTTKEVDEDVLGVAIKDGIYEAMADFLKRDEVQQNMEREERTKPDFDPLTMELGQAIEGLNEAQQATVTIMSGDQKGHGSGCVIGKSGYIVTNYHVVASGKDNLKVRLNNGQKLKAELIRKNPFSDLALIKVDKAFDKTYTIPVDKSYKPGMTAYAIGTPESVELGQTLTKGIISGVREHKDDTYLQSDVSVNPGSSGGALVNEKGYFVGVVSSKIMGYANEGISFSFPAHLVDDRLSIKYASD